MSYNPFATGCPNQREITMQEYSEIVAAQKAAAHEAECQAAAEAILDERSSNQLTAERSATSTLP